ncbi:MAG: Na(+)-translocating NADH-quinone reductase subunit A [Muribaculaceae bacterium]|nr:Na(+)-translocating NADH-quinone reductase subunit A [Muribaculaceae bacterium]
MALIKLKRGFDLNLKGQIKQESVADEAQALHYAVIPDDFTGVIPRMEKKPGEHVVAGDVLYHDKNDEKIKVTSPVSGTLAEVVRGDRRKILAVVIAPDNKGECKTFDTRSNPKELLLESGLWAMIRQRPYDIVPTTDVRPRDIFITAFDSSPLAPSLKMVLGEDEKYLGKAVEVLSTMTDGKVYLGCPKDYTIDDTGAETNTFVGPHPAGNAGVQIANIKPVNKGEVVWTLDVITAARIGKLFETGKVDYSTIVALTGIGVDSPCYVKAKMGCTLKSLLEGRLVNNDKEKRIISGNVLTGVKESLDGYLHAPYRHITVINEINKKDEFMGWASLSPKKYSIYRDFTTWIFGGRHKEVDLDAKINGGERAIVLSGEYDRMLPMDIYAEFLIKAIISFDIDKMEQLGIYEVAPEDFALAEYADTSKLELQRIVREGLDKMRAEMC